MLVDANKIEEENLEIFDPNRHLGYYNHWKKVKFCHSRTRGTFVDLFLGSCFFWDGASLLIKFSDY